MRCRGYYVVNKMMQSRVVIRVVDSGFPRDNSKPNAATAGARFNFTIRFALVQH